jgi:hypothetical protein
MGSGQFGSPWERRHWANVRRPAIQCCTTAWEQSPAVAHCVSWPCSWFDPVIGIRSSQLLRAPSSRDVLTPSCCASPFGICPLPVGSGKFGTPWVRMQAEYATAEGGLEVGEGEPADVPPVLGVPPEPLLHAASSAAKTAALVTALASRPRRDMPLTDVDRPDCRRFIPAAPSSERRCCAAQLL